MINARDRIYTGKVSKWGLPDGTVVAVYNDEDEMWLFSPYYISPIEDSAYQCYLTEYEYKIKSLPAGYKFNDAGEIVKEEDKRYWDGKEPLEVGMVVLFEGEKCKIKLPSDSELNYVLKDRIGQWVIVDKNDILDDFLFKNANINHIFTPSKILVNNPMWACSIVFFP